MNWTIDGRPFPITFFAGLSPEEVLYDFDGPRIFTIRDECHQLHLASWCDEDESRARFLVVPMTEVTLDRLKRGQMTVRETLIRGRLWVVETEHGAGAVRAWQVEPDTLPRDVLPEAGTLLWPELRPPLALRQPPERREVYRRAEELIRKKGLWAA